MIYPKSIRDLEREIFQAVNKFRAELALSPLAQPPSAGGSVAEGDALEMLRKGLELSEGWDNLDGERIREEYRTIIAALEAERASTVPRASFEHALKAMRQSEEALTAEQRAHKETKAELGRESAWRTQAASAGVTLAKACGRNGFGTWTDIANDASETIAQLQRDLAERTRERDRADECARQWLAACDLGQKHLAEFCMVGQSVLLHGIPAIASALDIARRDLAERTRERDCARLEARANRELSEALSEEAGVRWNEDMSQAPRDGQLVLLKRPMAMRWWVSVASWDSGWHDAKGSNIQNAIAWASVSKAGAQ